MALTQRQFWDSRKGFEDEERRCFMRSFLEVDDLTVKELNRVIDLCIDANPPKVLEGEGVALVFQKPSNRTRNSRN